MKRLKTLLTESAMARRNATARALLMMFPRVLREAALDDTDFRQGLGLKLNTVINLSADGLRFDRSVFFSTAQALLGGQTKRSEIITTDGSHWTLSFEEADYELVLSREGSRHEIPNLSCLSPNRDFRLAWFERESTKYDWNDERSRLWRDVFNARAIEDEEVDQLFGEFR